MGPGVRAPAYNGRVKQMGPAAAGPREDLVSMPGIFRPAPARLARGHRPVHDPVEQGAGSYGVA